MRLAHLLDVNHLSTAPATAKPSRAGTCPQPAINPSGDQASVDAAFDEVLNRLLPCRNSDPEIWFAEGTAQVEAAKALCRECPLIAGCLAGALERAEPWGVWGGEVFVDGVVVAVKRGRGRPRKNAVQAVAPPELSTAA